MRVEPSAAAEPEELPAWRPVLGCLEREIAMRRRVYPGLVRAGKMTALESEREIQLMRVAWRLLRGLASLPETAALVKTAAKEFPAP
jgi:hypothetical protein